MKGYLMRLGANGALAEDLAQEAMLLLLAQGTSL